MGLINGLREGPFSQSISKRHPTSLPEVQERAEKYINLEEASQLRKPTSVERERNNKRGGEELGKEKYKKRGEEEYSSQAQKYHSVEKLPTPRQIKSRRAGNKDEYCEYHRVYGHHTNDCYDLKNVIEKLAREGRLDRFIKLEGPSRRDNRRGVRPMRGSRTTGPKTAILVGARQDTCTRSRVDLLPEDRPRAPGKGT
ncbi:hypothetical protein PIB30_004243 [Stylosanthes scabra]|uniref:Reverse transcriptase domain-containing protein n=1 Tax=Stylosanthes scabra TaxID=79078 RepID=A0ABU6S317_9FABA|nr:hypothetical protein [Stylosanthes scabra]